MHANCCSWLKLTGSNSAKIEHIMKNSLRSRIYNRRIHQKKYIHTVGGHSTSRNNNNKSLSRYFSLGRTLYTGMIRVRQNCCQLEDLRMLSGALHLPTFEGGSFYSLWHVVIYADIWCFSVTALTVGEPMELTTYWLAAPSHRQDVLRSVSRTTNLSLVGGQHKNITG